MEEPCQRPEGFDLATYWAKRCAKFKASWLHYSVTVRVAPDLVPILPQFLGERVQALIQQADPPDAEGWITLTLPFETFEGARTTMLGFGTSMEVLGTVESREGVVERIVAFYEGKQRRDDAVSRRHRLPRVV